MTYNAGKLIVAALLAVVLIVAVVIDDDAASWAVPLLGLLVGYVVGNAEFTARTGAAAPIIERD